MSALCLRLTDTSLHFSFLFGMARDSVLGRFRSVLFCSQVEAVVFLVRDATQSVFHLLLEGKINGVNVFVVARFISTTSIW